MFAGCEIFLVCHPANVASAKYDGHGVGKGGIEVLRARGNRQTWLPRDGLVQKEITCETTYHHQIGFSRETKK